MQIVFFISGLFFGSLIAWVLFKILDPKIIFKEVENKNKKPTSDDKYWLLETPDDSYLFTEEQLKRAKERAEKNPEDLV